MTPVRLTEAQASRTRKPVDLATTLATQLSLVGWSGWEREYLFHPSRKWRIDIAFPHSMLAIECEGMGAGGKAGRHQLTQHIHGNTEKHSALAVAGWRLIRVTGLQVKSGHALQWIEATIGAPPRPDPFADVTDWDALWYASKPPRRARRKADRWTAEELSTFQDRRSPPMKFNRIRGRGD